MSPGFFRFPRDNFITNLRPLCVTYFRRSPLPPLLEYGVLYSSARAHKITTLDSGVWTLSATILIEINGRRLTG